MLRNLCSLELCFPQNHQTPHRPVSHSVARRSAPTAFSGCSPTTTGSAWGPSRAPRCACRASFAGMPAANVSAWRREICCAASRQLHRHWWGDITLLPRVHWLTGPPHTHTHTSTILLPHLSCPAYVSSGEQRCENILFFFFHFAIEMTSFQLRIK